MPYVGGTRAAELNFSYFLTESFDSGCDAKPLSCHLSTGGPSVIIMRVCMGEIEFET